MCLRQLNDFGKALQSIYIVLEILIPNGKFKKEARPSNSIRPLIMNDPVARLRGINCHAGRGPASSLYSWIALKLHFVPGFRRNDTRGKPRGIGPKAD